MAMSVAIYNDELEQILVDMVEDIKFGSFRIALGPHRVTYISQRLDSTTQKNQVERDFNVREAYKKRLHDEIRQRDNFELQIIFSEESEEPDEPDESDECDECEEFSYIKTQASAVFLNELPDVLRELGQTVTLVEVKGQLPFGRPEDYKYLEALCALFDDDLVECKLVLEGMIHAPCLLDSIAAWMARHEDHQVVIHMGLGGEAYDSSLDFRGVVPTELHIYNSDNTSRSDRQAIIDAVPGVVKHLECCAPPFIEPELLDVTSIVGPATTVSSGNPLVISCDRIKSLSFTYSRKLPHPIEPFFAIDVQCQADTLELVTYFPANLVNQLLESTRPLVLEVFDSRSPVIAPPVYAPTVKICHVDYMKEEAATADMHSWKSALPNVCWIGLGNQAVTASTAIVKLCAYFSVGQQPVFLDDSRYFFMERPGPMTELVNLATVLVMRDLQLVDTVAAALVRAVLLIDA
eukprot:TRINITY_DN12581_c1_g6_i2.p1 TRINITY_DN12581_c1_g6~~TRINITY_DN12581_c1_g6_i2.p1  ORF type:complete len:464 (+),score=43.59 TRINITY_DN12581_c1_g6_i2:1157-2548(+)